MEQNKKNSTHLMIMLSVICIFILGVFATLYIYTIKSSSNSYQDKFNIYIKAINKANLSTEDFIKDGVINTQITRSNIPSIISSLQNTKDNILILKPTDKLELYQTALIQGLTNNINIYTELLKVLNNPNAVDISYSRDNVKSFKEACIKYYSLVPASNVKIGLEISTISFIDSSIYYMNQLVKIKKNQSISDSQNIDFINGIDETFKNFQIIKTDFKAFLYSLRNNNGNYDDLINLIIKNKTDLSNLKIDFGKISIPQKSLDSDPIVIFNTLKTTMTHYDQYLDSFTYALSNEKVQASRGSIDKSIVDKFYTESAIKMAGVITDYNNFIEVYNSFKDIK